MIRLMEINVQDQARSAITLYLCLFSFDKLQFTHTNQHRPINILMRLNVLNVY